MRRLRLVLTITLVIAATLAGYSLAPRIDLSWLTGERSAWKLDYASRADLSTAYITDHAWMTFSLPPGTAQIKLITAPNAGDIAALRNQRTHDPLRRWKYAIDIEALDSQGRPTLARTHHLRADLAEIRDTEGRTITPTFHLSDELTPLGSAVIHLNLNGLPEAARVRVRLRSKDAELADVSLRLYIPEKISDRQVAYLWSRLSAAQKERLAKGNVFSHELLLENEKRNLLRNSWQPIGPLGTRGVDFRQRDLYVLNDYQGEPVDDPVPPTGVVFGSRLLASIPLPERGGHVRLNLRPLSATAPASTPLPITVRWFGPGPYARSSRTFAWYPERPEFTAEFGGGILELSAPVEFVVRAYLGMEKDTEEITPEAMYERPFAVTADTPLEYTLRHENDGATPLRITLRHLLPDTTVPAPAPAVQYQFLDAHGTPLAKGTLALLPGISPYDKVFGESTDVGLSESTTVYVATPPKAALLRLLPAEESGLPVLASVANRPGSLPHQSRLPADRFAYDPRQERLPVWFPLRPENYEAHLLAGRSRLVSVQQRPPEEHPELLRGAFQWHDLPPDGQWLGRQVLSPREPGAPWREDALPATYSPLPANRSRTLEFPPYLGVAVIAPRLAWAAEGGPPWAAEIWLDGRLHQRLHGNPGYGETELLPFPAGKHRLRVETSRPLRLFVNHTRPGSDAYLARLAVPAATPHTYTADLRGGEELTLRLFAPSGSKRANRLRIRIEGPPPPAFTPREAWLLTERDVVLQPAPPVGMPVFDTNGQRVDAGQPVFLPIPEGAPGRYRIHVELQEGPGGYLLLSCLTTDLQARRRLLNEPALERHLEVRE